MVFNDNDASVASPHQFSSTVIELALLPSGNETGVVCLRETRQGSERIKCDWWRRMGDTQIERGHFL